MDGSPRCEQPLCRRERFVSQFGSHVGQRPAQEPYAGREIRGSLETQQGTGTFIRDAGVKISPAEKRRLLEQICVDAVARAGAYGIALDEIVDALRDFREEH